MGSSTDSAFTMLDLKDFFLETLRARVESLRKALAGELSLGSPDEKEIRRVAHGICGAGGTYGFPELSEVAERADVAPVAELRERATELLEALETLTQSAPAIQTRVLLIEGNVEDASAIGGALNSPGRSVRLVNSAADAGKVLYEERFDLIVLDLFLPDLDGRSMLLRVQEHYRTSGVPVIVVTAKSNNRLVAECYQLGALQVFEKPVAPEVLRAAAVGAVERAEHSNRASTFDPLTGLPNRAGFHDALQRSVSMCQRSGEPICVAMLDLDHFKAINDTYGHLTGDEVLRRVGAVLREHTRRSDYVARWGGEEFAALFCGAPVAGATLALERFRTKIKAESFEASDGTKFGATFSAGVAEIDTDRTTEESIAEADRLLYKAKAAGRDRIVHPQTVVETVPSSILLAEDDELMAAAVVQTLKRHGYEVIHSSSSEAALDLIDDHDFSIGILDVNMPGMDGFELLSRLRRLPKFRNTPLIMLTARGEESDVVRGFDLGVDDYILKPFSPPELAARVHRLAKRR